MPPTSPGGLRRPGPLLLAVLAAAFALYLYHGWLYGDWINDDAGISFNYARNLAEGHGLVLNPGGSRVEGYSNPAWVFLLALASLGGLFHPVITPKVLAAVFTLGTFWSLARISGRLFSWPASVAHALPALLLACSVPFVSWSISGLENALFLFLLTGALQLHLGETSGPGRLPWSALLFFLLAITRPEGIIYGGAALVHRLGVAAFRWPLLKTTAVWAAFFAVPFAAYHAWHYGYFADWLPNTYYAKLERGTDLSWRLDKELYNLESTGWKYVRGAFTEYNLGWVLLPGGLLALVRFIRRAPAILLVLAVAALNLFYALYVGGDWMDQYRFLGPTFAVTCLMAAGAVMAVRPERDPALHDPALAGTKAERWSPHENSAARRFKIRLRRAAPPARSRSRRALSAAVMGTAALAAAALLVPANLWILQAETTHPSVSFARVMERGREIESLAETLFVDDPSLMDPDLGGTSYGSDLEMVDLGGLADAHIARYGYDPRFFLPYVLEERQPTFVRTHCVWSRDTLINSYDAFRADYIPLWERPCPLECCREFMDGEYIRRDVFVAGAGEALPGGNGRKMGSSIALASWELGHDVAVSGEELRVTTFWRALGPLPEDLSWSVKLSGREGTILEESHRFAHGIYPPSLWSRDEIIREVRDLRIPADAPRGEYRMWISVAGEGLSASAVLTEIDVDRHRVREEAEEMVRLHQQAMEAGSYEAAVDYMERALALVPGMDAWRPRLEAARDGLARDWSGKARDFMEGGDLEEAARFLLEGDRIAGRREPLGRAMEDLSILYEGRARELLAREDSFLHWTEAIAAFKTALRCHPANSRALLEVERLRGREYVARTWGEEILEAHRAGPEGGPVRPLLEEIQDDGFHEEALEIIRGSPAIRARLEAQGTLGSLALLHQAAGGGDQEMVRRLDGLLERLELANVNQGDRLLFLGSEILPQEDGRIRFSFWFRVTGRMRTDYRMFLHGYVKDKSLLPEDRKEFEFANFDHDVRPSTSRWRPGTIVRHTWTAHITPGEYRFLFGFFNSKKKRNLKVEGKRTAAVELGWRTIPEIPGNESD